jgi:hypothetical protein
MIHTFSHWVIGHTLAFWMGIPQPVQRVRHGVSSARHTPELGSTQKRYRTRRHSGWLGRHRRKLRMHF